MAEERAQFVVTLDASQARSSLNALTSDVDTLVDRTPVLARGLSNIEEAAKALHSQTRTASQAIMGLSLVMGESQTETAKMFREASHLATAFITGGPLVAGLTAAAIGAKKFQEALNDAEASMRAYDDGIEHLGVVTRARGTAELTEMRNELLKTEAALRHFGETSRQAQLDDAKLREIALQQEFVTRDAAVAREKVQLEDVKKTLIGGSRVYGQAAYQAAVEASGPLIDSIKLNETRKQQLQEELTTIFAQVKATQELANKETEAKDAKKEARTESKQEALEQRIAERIQRIHANTQAKVAEANLRYKEEDQKAADKAEAAKEKAEEKLTTKLQRELEKRLKQEEEANKRVAESYERLYGGIVDGALNNASSSMQSFLTGMVQGQKDAAQKAVSEFLKSEGQQLVGTGTRAIFEGAIISANPLTPGAGAGMIAIGGAAIAAGLAMGAGGAALTPPTATGTGSLSSAATSGGVNRGTGGGGGSGGAAQAASVTIIYGAAGPAPQDTGRQVYAALQAFRNSTGVSDPPNIQGPKR